VQLMVTLAAGVRACSFAVLGAESRQGAPTGRLRRHAAYQLRAARRGRRSKHSDRMDVVPHLTNYS